MAIKDEQLTYPTDCLVSLSGRTHYEVLVKSQHWQLRSLISTDKEHFVYFPGGDGSTHVQRLNTHTRECETIKSLTFAPRCLVASAGWLCCGSENGEFVAIRLEQDCDEFGANLDLSSDDRLPFGLINDTSLQSLLGRARRTGRNVLAKSSKLAKDRVNCITLWSPPRDQPVHKNAYSSPVAVLANNDQTVTLVNLEDFQSSDDKSEVLDVIIYPDFVNRAIISPDGQMLVAILDDPYLYIHVRAQDPPTSRHAAPSSTHVTYSWKLLQRVLLKSQQKHDKSDSRGSFAACFSSSGAYLAVGTQHGTISVFDATQLANVDVDPLITTFQSSRPESGPGAVRDMAFCPGPYDILAWTEDRGHIGLTDVRSNFKARQIIDISAPSSFNRVGILDRNTVDPRLLDNRGEQRSGSLSQTYTNDGVSSALSTRRRRHEVSLEHLNRPLDDDDTRILRAIRAERARRDQAVLREAQRTIENLTGRQMSVTEPAQSETAYYRSRSTGRASTSDRVPSGVSGSDRNRDSAVRRPRDTSLQQSQDLSTDFEFRWADRFADPIGLMRAARERAELPNTTVSELFHTRERPMNDQGRESIDPLTPAPAQGVTNRWTESAVRATLSPPNNGIMWVPPSPDNTSGLSWSEDGRVLFVGAENGIYELHVDVQSRKYSPSIVMR